jgi:membrane fusion protein (multidrug efflux system)
MTSTIPVPIQKIEDMFRVAVIALAGLFVLAACTNETTDSARNRAGDKAVTVVVEPVRFSDELTRIEAVGTSRAVQSVTITPETSGEVVAVKFGPGQRVNKDDVLVELDARKEQLAVELARIRRVDAKRLFDRYERTADSGAILPTVLDAARTALETAEVELQQAQIALDDRVIRAPFAGYVGISEIDPGDRIDTSTVVTTIDNRDALLVSFEVPEIMVGTLKTGEEIAISPWNDENTTARGVVVDIGSRIDPLTRTYTVRASVDNLEDKLRPGMSFRVRLDIRGRSFPVIPEIAVQWGADGSHVWRVTAGQASRIPVRIIQRQQGQVLVDGALAESELIVVEGVQRMYEGIKVEHTVREQGKYEQMEPTVKIES